MNTSQQHGFTLWELMLTLVIGAILLGIGVPNVMEFQRNGAMTAAANDLVTGVLMARTEAVKRQAFVTVCLTDDPLAATPACQNAAVVDSTTRGFIVFVDENDNFDAAGARILNDVTDGNAAVDINEQILMRSVPRGAPMMLSASHGCVSYGPNGFTRPAGGACFPAGTARFVVYCDDRGRRATAGSFSSARAIRIDRPGRAQVLQDVALVNAVIGAVGATCP
jgi:type IV fimbrial biogenesis protein FimT